MGEIVVQRDDQNRILALTGRDIPSGGIGSASLFLLLQAGVSAMVDYLHVDPEFLVGEEVRLVVDRSDPHLNRETDAIMETLVIGLKILAKEYPSGIVVQDETVGMQV